MEVELVAPQVLSDAVAAIARGEDGVREGLAALLEGRLAYKENESVSGCAQTKLHSVRNLDLQHFY
jgi:hypothetical protein